MIRSWFVVRWVLALCGLLALTRSASAAEWQDGNGYRFKALEVEAGFSAGFTSLSPELTGLYFTNVLARARFMTNQIYLNGSGVAAADIDGDERVDVFFAGLDGPNRLFRNLGDWKFAEISETAGVAAPELDATGAAFADIDGDDDFDLLLNTVGQGTHLFTNNGEGKFTWRTQRAAPNAGKGGMSLALADVEGDGDLDLYLANYRTWTYRDRPRPKIKGRHINGKPTVVSFDGRPTTEPDLVGRFTLSEGSKIIENGEIDALFLNNGQGSFRQVRFTDGTFLDAKGRPLEEEPFEWGLSVMFRDMNGDLAPDLYVCNDFSSPDRIWMNQGDGSFRLMGSEALRNTSRFSMGVDFADLDRDGYDDFVVMDMLSREHRRRMVQMGEPPLSKERGDAFGNRPQFSRNTLYRNRGDGTYAELAYWAGLHAAEWAWTPIFMDVDLDGFEDLLVSNGYERDALNADVRSQIENEVKNPRLSRQDILALNNLFERLPTPNAAFRNQGDFSFEDVSDMWGFAVSEVSQGMALADLDGDGDQDVLINNMNAPATVLRNNASNSRVAVRLRGDAPNTAGVGAKIRLRGSTVAQSQEVILGGRYLSSDDPMRVFALKNGEGADLEVSWRSGKTSVVRGVKSNRLYEIFESLAEQRKDTDAVESKPMFSDQSHLLRHNHHDPPFDEFFRQPLLPRGLSQLGPGVAWVDLNRDGFDDLVVGTGRGGKTGVLLSDGRGRFRRGRGGWTETSQQRDQVGIAAWVTSDQGPLVAVGRSNYEDGSLGGAGVTIVAGGDGESVVELPAWGSSTGPLAASDIDGDGDIDLFVGGRVEPGRYPLASDSRLFVNETGTFRESSLSRSLFQGIGMVSAAVWSDLRGDGYADLILACEWGPIRVFDNLGGNLRETTGELGFDKLKGWWQGVTSGDFDGDGRMDLVASNWGRNHFYQPFGAAGMRWFVERPNGAKAVSIFEGYLDDHSADVWPLRSFGVYQPVIPDLSQRIRSFKAFAGQSMKTLLGEGSAEFQEFTVETFAHTVFLNRGDRFEAIELPGESQWAPAFAVVVGDLDGDGREDLFLSQNMFHLRPDMTRLDAGRGLLLLGDGRGGFRAVSGQESGVKIYGQQRGAALGDYNRDGRLDLVVAQNGSTTRLLRNEEAPVGMRVLLDAGSSNQTGIGAVLQVEDKDGWGRVQEIKAGSGYWSQDSAVQVVKRGASRIRILWPGGDEVAVAVPKGAREISIDRNGNVKLLR